MDVKYLHTGEPVLVLEEGSGEPGTWNGTGSNAQWAANGDFKPARVVRLGAVEEVEQGQIADSYDATSTVAREQAAAAGDLGDRPTDVQFVHEPEQAVLAPTGSGEPVVGRDPTGAPLRDDSVVHPDAPAQVPDGLSVDERAELEALRHEQAQRQAADADVTRDTTPS